MDLSLSLFDLSLGESNVICNFTTLSNKGMKFMETQRFKSFFLYLLLPPELCCFHCFAEKFNFLDWYLYIIKTCYPLNLMEGSCYISFSWSKNQTNKPFKELIFKSDSYLFLQHSNVAPMRCFKNEF